MKSEYEVVRSTVPNMKDDTQHHFIVSKLHGNVLTLKVESTLPKIITEALNLMLELTLQTVIEEMEKPTGSFSKGVTE